MTLNEAKIGNFDFKKYFKPIAEFMKKDGLNVSPYPKVKLDWSEQDGLFIKTGYYEPESKTITIFCDNRHPKDILRTFCHEMIHHSQNLDGVDLNFSSKDDVKDNERLEEIESEAYLKGNVYFRKWTEYQNKSKDILQENSNDRKVNKYIKERFGLTDFQEIRNKVMEIYEKIPYARIDGGQYMLGIMRLLFDENLPREDYGILNKILYRIGNCNYSEKAGVCNSNLGGLSFEELKDKFFIPDFEGTEFSTAEKQIKLPNGYTITRIDSYDEMNAMCDGEWCISYDESMWYELIPNETVYLVENESMIDKFDELMENPEYSDKFSDIAYAAGEEDEMRDLGLIVDGGYAWTNKLGSWKFPYDYYGLSRFVVLVGEKWLTVYSRYNMPNEFDGDYLSKEQLEKLLGVNFNDVFKYVPRDDSNGHYDNYGRWRVDAQPAGVIQENIENEKWNGDGEEMNFDYPENVPKYLFHVSPIKNRESIKRLGLIPSVGEEYEDWWSYEGPNGEIDDNELPELVFMTSNPDTWVDRVGYGGYDLYQIDTDKLDKDDISYDPTPHLAKEGCYCYGQTIPPSALKLVKTFSDDSGDNDIIYEETKPEDIDLSSFDIKTALNPKFWKDGHLDSRIRMRLLDIADDFIDFIGIDWVEPDDIIITGSLANYNWNKKFSDIDLHIVLDYSKVDKRRDFVKNYFDSQKQLWNENHRDLKIFGFPIEVYVQDKNEKHSSTGVYSLDKDKWITEPERKKLKSTKINKKYIKKKVAEYADIVDELEKNYKDANGDYALRKVSEKADKLFDRIKSERSSGLKSSDNEISNGNIIYKCLRRLGCIDKIFDIKDDAYNALNSLSEGRTLLKEDQEGDSMKKARRYLVQNHGYTEERASEVVRNEVRQEFSVLHHNERAGKFIFGLTRILFDENINSATKGRLNLILKLISSSDELYNSFDKNLNGLSAIELVSKFENEIEKEVETERNSESNAKERQIKDYKIVRIDSFEDSSRYSKYTDFDNNSGHWCLTHMKNMYDSYTNDGRNQIYFCLKNGFENLKPVVGQDCPLDEFGLSMLSIIVDPNGGLLYATCRWNHLNGGDDHVLSVRQIEELLGVKFTDVFLPSHDAENAIKQNVKNFYKTGDINCFNSVESLEDFFGDNSYIVWTGDYSNILRNGRLMFDGWFDSISYDPDMFGIIVRRNSRCNILTREGKFLFKSWLLEASECYFGFIVVVNLDGYYNLLNKEGKLIIDWCLWTPGFDDDQPYAIVSYNEGYNYVDTNGRLTSKEWFDEVTDFRNGFAIVTKDGLQNFIDDKGNLLLKHWVNDCSLSYSCEIGFITTDCEDIENNVYRGTYIIDTKNRRFINKTPYEYVSQITDNLFVVGISTEGYDKNSFKYNILSMDGSLILEKWVEEIGGATRDNDGASYCRIKDNGLYNVLRIGEGFVLKKWYNFVKLYPIFNYTFIYVSQYADGGNDDARVWNIADKDGNLLLKDWFENIEIKASFQNGIYFVVTTLAKDKDGNLVRGDENVTNSNGEYLLPFWVFRVERHIGDTIVFDVITGEYGRNINTYTYFIKEKCVIYGAWDSEPSYGIGGAYSVDEFINKYGLTPLTQ